MDSHRQACILVVQAHDSAGGGFFDYRCVGIFLDSVHLRTSRYGKGKRHPGIWDPVVQVAAVARGLERNDKAVQ